MCSACKLRRMASAIKCWLKVDDCLTIMSYDGLACYLIFRPRLRPLSLLYITNIIHMTTFVSWWLNTICIMYKIIALFIITLLAMLYVRVDILHACRKQLHDHFSTKSKTGCLCLCIIVRRVWAYQRGNQNL